MVSATYKDGKELLWDFNFDKNLINFNKYWNLTTFIHAKDDDLVDFSDFQDFKKVIKEADFLELNSGKHFVQERFIFIEDCINNLS
jgi:hypothetical protein